MFVIRKSSLTEEQYLDRKGQWGPYPKAKRFSTQDAAEKFMDAHNASDGGIFTCWRARELWELRGMTFDLDEARSQRPTDRVFIVTPNRDGDTVFQVCTTTDSNGALVSIHAQDDYEVVENCTSMDEAKAFCAVQYGLDKVETV